MAPGDYSRNKKPLAGIALNRELQYHFESDEFQPKRILRSCNGVGNLILD